MRVPYRRSRRHAQLSKGELSQAAGGDDDPSGPIATLSIDRPAGDNDWKRWCTIGRHSWPGLVVQSSRTAAKVSKSPCSMPIHRQSEEFQRLGAVSRLFRPPAVHPMRDLPLPKTPEAAILAHNLP